MSTSETQTNRLYWDPGVADAWIAGDIGGDMWIVPAADNGWRRRSVCRLDRTQRRHRLREVPTHNATGLGIPRLAERTLPQIVGDRIRAARKAAGWTQVELAEAADKSQGTISDLEAGRVWPAAETLTDIASALPGCSEAALLG